MGVGGLRSDGDAKDSSEGADGEVAAFVIAVVAITIVTVIIVIAAIGVIIATLPRVDALSVGVVIAAVISTVAVPFAGTGG